MRAGLAVPEAWCLPAGVTPDIELLEKLWSEIENTGRRKQTVVAVRSSATSEDLINASAAGIYETVLGVTSLEDLMKAVDHCMEAFNSERARAYRHTNNQTDASMALLIQRQIASEISGVLLTTNPRRPFAPDYVIDAAYGLGEGVVSGKVDPDHVVIDAGSGEVIEERIGGKAIAIVLDENGGTRERSVARKRSSRRALNAEQIHSLFQLARKLDERVGVAQDCEWAIERGKLHVLQVRPIPNLPSRQPDEVWSRRFGDEYLSSWTSPLGHTFLTRWITEWMFQDLSRRAGRKELAKIDPLRRYHGYVYISGSYIRSMMSAMPPSARTIGGTGEQAWFTPLWIEKIKSTPFDPIAMIRMLMLPLTDPRGPMTRNIKALQNHCKRIETEIAPKLDQDYRSLSTEQWFDQIDEIDRFGAEHFKVIRWGMGQHSATLHSLIQALLRAWCNDDDGSIYRDIVSGLSGMKTTKINRDVWRLGLLARSDPALGEAIKKGVHYEELRANFPSSPMWQEFDEFLAQHGHRSSSREIAEERWRERPEIVIGFICTQLHSEEVPPDPTELERDSLSRRKAAEELALKRAGSGIVGPLKKAFLQMVIMRTQTFTRYREDQRYYLDFLLAHCRLLVLEMGRRLANAGVLKDASEVFFLEANELFEQARSPASDTTLRKILDERIEDWRIWHDRLPATYLFDDIETEGEIAEGRQEQGASEPAGDRVLSGLGASRGTARGKVRVVHTLNELNTVEPGNILVSETIDPGWTSVFPILGGLVTETGGILSHGALLAREYGIPAVMGIHNATRILVNEAEIFINGASGKIIVESEGER